MPEIRILHHLVLRIYPILYSKVHAHVNLISLDFLQFFKLHAKHEKHSQIVSVACKVCWVMVLNSNFTLHYQPALFDIQSQAWPQHVWFWRHVQRHLCKTPLCIKNIREPLVHRKEKTTLTTFISCTEQAKLPLDPSFTALWRLLSLSNTSRQINGGEKRATERDEWGGWEDKRGGRNGETWGKKQTSIQSVKKEKMTRGVKWRCGEGGEGWKGDWRIREEEREEEEEAEKLGNDV